MIQLNRKFSRMLPVRATIIFSKRIRKVTAAAAIFLWASAGPAFALQKKVVGRIEKVKICPGNLEFKAKIDTGARHSSLDVSDVAEFERKGEKWIRFDVVNYKGQRRTFEKKIVREALIKRHKNKPASRHVIKLGVCLGEYFQEVEFTLADRTGFNYRMLIGCSFISGVCIVDPALNFTTSPNCRNYCSD